MLDSVPYQAYYCEENVWQLADALGTGFAVFISNEARTVAMWLQRLAEPGHPVVWDYHVVFVRREALGLMLFDRDCRLDCPCPVSMWLAQSFPKIEIPDAFRPRFRVIDAQAYLRDFASDRSHMKRDDQWSAPPPPWDCIGHGHNLWSFVPGEEDARDLSVALAEAEGQQG